MSDVETVARRFMLHAIQDWGQSEADRLSAVQGVLDAAGFNATATCGPVFAGIWPKPCTGPDGDAASKFLKALTDTLRRGKFEDEVAHVAAQIRGRTAAPA